MFKPKTVHSSSSRCPCSMGILPLKDVYQKMLEDLVTYFKLLCTADSSKLIQSIMRDISMYQVDSRVSDNIRNMVTDIQKKIYAMHMYNYTSAYMGKDLVALYFALCNAIHDEEYKEVQEQRNRFILKVIADHPEEFQKWFSQFTHEYL